MLLRTRSAGTHKIMGRQRNLISYPDGSRLWPSFPSHVWTSVAPIEQFQIIQRTVTTLEIRYVCGHELVETEQNGIARELEQSLGHGFDLTFTRFTDEIPRGPGGKYEDFICELDFEDAPSEP